MKNIGLVLMASIVLPLTFTQANAEGVSKYGITLDECLFDYEGENFCNDKRLKSYSKVIKTRKANFDSNKILYIFETNEEGYVGKKPYRMVVINKDTGLVSPFGYSLSEATDGEGNPQVINSKGDIVEFKFNLNSDRFCFQGNIGAYRDSYDYQSGPFCFSYDEEQQNLVRDF